MRTKIISFGAIGTTLLLAATIVAAQSPLQQGMDIARFQMSDDVYTAGGKFTVSELVAGDLVAAGGEMHVTGNVRRDVIAAGGQVELTGPVGDDVRVAGGDVVINSKVAGDMVVTGGDVTIGQNATIGGDLAVFGGKITMLGAVKGKLTAKGGEVAVGGTVGGDADVMAGMFTLDGIINGKSTLVADTMKFGPRSKLTQNVRYWTKAGQMNLAPARPGTAGTVYDPALAPQRGDSHMAAKWIAGIAGIWAFYSVLASALLAFIFLMLFPGTFKDAGTLLQKKPWKALLTGFLYYVVTPIAAGLFFLTIIGIPVGLLLMALYFVTVLAGSVLTSLVLTRWMEHRMKAKWHMVVLVGVSVGILIVLKLLWFIPVFGWLIKALLTFFAVGALCMSMWSRKKHA